MAEASWKSMISQGDLVHGANRVSAPPERDVMDIHDVCPWCVAVRVIVSHGVGVVRVLVVDDHVPYRRLVARLLRAEGFDVIGAVGTGREAVEQTRMAVPDVVLLDVLLPDFDGFEVARRIALLPARPVVVFISSRQRDEFGPFVDGLVCWFISKDEFTVERLHGLLLED
jgi:CheY-like chemotaxis protein